MKSIKNLGKLKNFLENNDTGIFLYTKLKNKTNYKSFLFLNPINKITCQSPSDIIKCFTQIEKVLKKGFYVAGFISYEAGYFLEKKLKNAVKNLNFPLFTFFIFKKPIVFRTVNLNKIIKSNNDYAIYNFRSNIKYKNYKKNFLKIKKLIQNGEIYQLNYCFKLKFDFKGKISSFFLDLIQNQKVSYCALIKTTNYSILSFSPELFFRISNSEITMKPMKGTLLKTKKVRNLIKNLENEKNKAENVMIVDLIRNDLGKICKINSIKVPALFTIEEYETLYQMTSEIKGKLRTKNIYEIFKAIFPSGSVTGTPKIRAMELIKKFEKENRNIYTGAIGFISPFKNTVFNIPIRTIMLYHDKGEIGIGSGIVNDSKTKSEFTECIGKANFLTSLSKPFSIIETIRIIKNKGYFLLNLHLKRLKKSCDFFNFYCNLNLIKKSLKKIKPDNNYKIRLLVYPNGNFKIKKYLYKLNNRNLITFSKLRINSQNLFFYHKTTNRKLYDSEYKKAKANGFYDFIFLNKNLQVTEGCISNIFIKKNGIFYTPPVKCGLLPGVFREYLLKKNPDKFKEKILYKKDILNANEIYMCNSVSGLKRVFLLK